MSNSFYFCWKGLAYCYLERAMIARWEPPVVEKTGLSQIQAYDNWRECQTVGELAAIAHNPNAIHMEGLCIRERVLGMVRFMCIPTYVFWTADSDMNPYPDSGLKIAFVQR